MYHVELKTKPGILNLSSFKNLRQKSSFKNGKSKPIAMKRTVIGRVAILPNGQARRHIYIIIRYYPFN